MQALIVNDLAEDKPPKFNKKKGILFCQGVRSYSNLYRQIEAIIRYFKNEDWLEVSEIIMEALFAKWIPTNPSIKYKYAYFDISIITRKSSILLKACGLIKPKFII